jgi:hypothetical protein
MVQMGLYTKKPFRFRKGLYHLLDIIFNDHKSLSSLPATAGTAALGNCGIKSGKVGFVYHT